MKRTAFLLLGASLTLAACESTTPVESDFGNSVRQMRDAQTLDRDTITNPSDKPVIGADPYVVNTAVEEMRKDVPDREKSQGDVVINVGNTQKR
jgi:hypothetical protein